MASCFVALYDASHSLLFPNIQRMQFKLGQDKKKSGTNCMETKQSGYSGTDGSLGCNSRKNCPTSNNSTRHNDVPKPHSQPGTVHDTQHQAQFAKIQQDMATALLSQNSRAQGLNDDSGEVLLIEGHSGDFHLAHIMAEVIWRQKDDTGDSLSKKSDDALCGIGTELKLTLCLKMLANAVVGSDAWLHELRRACALCDEGILRGPVAELRAVVLKLMRLSWETDGGPMVAVIVHPHLQSLWHLHQKYPCVSKGIAAEVMVDIWVGLASRLCDARLLNNIDFMSRQWHLVADECMLIQERKTVASCDIEVVHLLLSINSREGLWKQSPALFSRRIQKILATLTRLCRSDSSCKERAMFLAVQVILTLRDFLQRSVENRGSPGFDVQCNTDAAEPGAEKDGQDEKEQYSALLSDLDKSSQALSHMFSPVNPHSDLLGCLGVSMLSEEKSAVHFSTMPHFDHSDVLPHFARSVLKDFVTERENQYRTVTPNDWDLWVCCLKRTEEFWTRMSHPCFRGVPGFWMHRDQYTRILQDFGQAYSKRMPLKVLRVVLDDTPDCAQLCAAKMSEWFGRMLCSKAEARYCCSDTQYYFELNENYCSRLKTFAVFQYSFRLQI